jgi:hypothetical protein
MPPGIAGVGAYMLVAGIPGIGALYIPIVGAGAYIPGPAPIMAGSVYGIPAVGGYMPPGIAGVGAYMLVAGIPGIGALYIPIVGAGAYIPGPAPIIAGSL